MAKTQSYNRDFENALEEASRQRAWEARAKNKALHYQRHCHLAEWFSKLAADHRQKAEALNYDPKQEGGPNG
jgi:hypothetical protein